MEGLLVAVHPLHILPQALAVVEHLPGPLFTVTVLAAAAVLLTAASCPAAICLGWASLAFWARLGSSELDGGSIVEERQLPQSGGNGVGVECCTATK